MNKWTKKPTLKMRHFTFLWSGKFCIYQEKVIHSNTLNLSRFVFGIDNSHEVNLAPQKVKTHEIMIPELFPWVLVSRAWLYSCKVAFPNEQYNSQRSWSAPHEVKTLEIMSTNMSWFIWGTEWFKSILRE